MEQSSARDESLEVPEIEQNDIADPGRKCCREGPEGQGLPSVSAVQDRVELHAKKSQLNLESIFPSVGAFSGTNTER